MATLSEFPTEPATGRLLFSVCFQSKSPQIIDLFVLFLMSSIELQTVKKKKKLVDMHIYNWFKIRNSLFGCMNNTIYRESFLQH